MTPWQKHKTKWRKCTECGLCETRKTVVLLRGSIPADVLLIGEAPGESEDVIGKPFCGPAGKLLDYIIRESRIRRYAITNLIACIPRDWEGGKLTVPPKDSVLACVDRLNECIDLVQPKLIIAVGLEAKKWLPKVMNYEPELFIDITHPAGILRMNVAQQGLAIQRAIVTIKDALEEVGL